MCAAVVAILAADTVRAQERDTTAVVPARPDTIDVVPGLFDTTALARSRSRAAERDTGGPSPVGAFYRSLAVPGWGQYANGRPVKGAIYLGIVAASAGMAIRNWENAIGANTAGSAFWSGRAWTHGRNNWLILGGLTWILCAVDAYVDSQMRTYDVSPLALDFAPLPGGGYRLGATLLLDRPRPRVDPP